MDAELEEIFTDYELSGMAVGLIANGEIAYKGVFGHANFKTDSPMSADTYVRIASISKFFTALAVMSLWEDGLVDIDKDVSDYLGWTLRNPNFPDEIITLRHLMDHKSGIRDGSGYSQFSGRMFSQELNIKELFTENGSFYTSNMFSDKMPDAYFSYSNAAWGLVATVIEKVSQMRFDKYCRQHVFQPMDLLSSYNVMDIPTTMVGAIYRAQNNAWVAQVDDYSVEPATERAPPTYQPGTNGLLFGPQGSLRTSLNDLMKVGLMLINDGFHNSKEVYKKETINFFSENRWVYNGSNGDTWDNFWLSYTKGIHFIENTPNGDIIFPDRKMMGHAGIAYGLVSDFYIDPVTKSGLVFFTNGTKQPYQYATSSSFYAVEDAAFEVLYAHLQIIEGN